MKRTPEMKTPPSREAGGAEKRHYRSHRINKHRPLLAARLRLARVVVCVAEEIARRAWTYEYAIAEAAYWRGRAV